LSKIAANAGKIEGAHRSLDPSASGGAGQNERVLLLFKYFDVHSQRLVTVGSAILWKQMSVQHLKQFLTALLQSRGIDLESHCRLPAPTTVERFEQLHRVNSASAAASKEEVTDADMIPAGASASLPFLAHMHRLGASAPSFAGAPAAPTPTDEVVEVHDVSSKNALSIDEQRYAMDSAEAQAAAAIRTVAQRGADAADQTEAMRIVQRQLSARDAQLDRLAVAQLAEVQRLRDQHESATKDLRESLQLKCGVCYDRRPSVLYLPCRHVFCCDACDGGLASRKCPKCNGAIAQTIGGVFIEAE